MSSASRLDRKVEYGALSSFYSALLTKNQRTMVRLYCDEDLSLGEIARQMDITRQGVCDTINRAFLKLDQFEEALGLSKRFGHMVEKLSLCGDKLNNVRATADTAHHLKEAQDILNSILEEEE